MQIFEVYKGIMKYFLKLRENSLSWLSKSGSGLADLKSAQTKKPASFESR